MFNTETTLPYFVSVMLAIVIKYPCPSFFPFSVTTVTRLFSEIHFNSLILTYFWILKLKSIRIKCPNQSLKDCLEQWQIRIMIAFKYKAPYSLITELALISNRKLYGIEAQVDQFRVCLLHCPYFMLIMMYYLSWNVKVFALLSLWKYWIHKPTDSTVKSSLRVFGNALPVPECWQSNWQEAMLLCLKEEI